MSNQTWTDARVKSFIVSVLRAGSRRWPPKYRSLAAAFTSQKINEKSGRLAKHYKCASCRQEFTSSNVQVDHIEPIIDPKVGFTTWDEFIKRLFCDESNLQVLCESCHKVKTNKEKQIAKEYSASKNADGNAGRGSRIRRKSK